MNRTGHAGHDWAVAQATDPRGATVFRPWCVTCHTYVGGWMLCSFGLDSLESAERLARHVTRPND